MRVLSMKSGAFISTAGVFGSAIFWLLSFKIVAYWQGPEGVGLFSQLRQIIQAATLGATFGGTNALVQGLSERDNEQDRQRFRFTSSRIIGVTGISTALFIWGFTPQISRYFLSSDAQEIIAVIRWVSLAVPLNVGAIYAMAVLNGYRFYRYLAVAQISGPLALASVLAGAYWLRISYRQEMLGWLYVLCFGLTYLVGLYAVFHAPGRAATIVKGGLLRSETTTFVKFALSNLLAALSATVALLLIRSWLIAAHGLAFSGLFDAGWTLTFNYTTLFLTACNAIYLPLLTRASDQQNQKKCILKTAYLVLVVCMWACYFMVSYRSQLLNLLYSAQFEASGELLTILSIAIIFRGVSWVYGTLIIATRRSSVLIGSDLAFNLGLLLLMKYFLQNFSSLESLGWAFVMTNFCYLIFAVEYACRTNDLMRRRHIWPLLLLASSPLFLLSALRASNTSYWAHIGLLFPIIGVIVSGMMWKAYHRLSA